VSLRASGAVGYVDRGLSTLPYRVVIPRLEYTACLLQGNTVAMCLNRLFEAVSIILPIQIVVFQAILVLAYTS